MTEETPKPSLPASEGPPRSALLILLLICLAGVAIVVYLVMRPADEMQETIISLIEVETPAEVALNVLDVIDTLKTPDVQAVEGQRYKVLVMDEAREGASGIARIGGLVTFVPGTQKGDVVVIEVTRLRRTTADAIVIERVDAGVSVPGRPDRAPPRDHPDRPVSELVGEIYRGTITDVGQEGDGVTHVDGKVVFVEGAARGEHVEFRIIEDMGRFARAEVVSKSPTPFDESPRARAVPEEDDDSLVGQVLQGTVTEMGRQGDGIVRVNSKVVFVEGSTIGQHVEFRVVEDRGRYARAVIVSVSDEPFDPIPTIEHRPVQTPEPQRDRVEVNVGEEFEVTVTDQDRRRPHVNGVARINGLVVFVPDTQPGDRVWIRIIERRPRSANAIVLERLPSESAER